MPSSQVMSKWKAGTLRSGSKSGPPVKSQAQAVAIMLSEKRKEGQHGGKYPHKAVGGGLGGEPPGGSLADNAQRWQGFESRFPKDAPPRDWNLTPGVIGNRGMTGLGQPPQWMSGGAGLPAVPPQGSPMAAFQHLQQLGAARLGQMDWQHMGQMPMTPPSSPDDKAEGGAIATKGGLEGAKRFMSSLYNISPQGYEQRLQRQGQEASDIDNAVRGLGGGYQFGGSPTSMGLTPGWIERQEARNISHTGPIISAVGGRTDNHAINVPSGSYVLPAAHVSAMGQGNTLNGMQILTRMFGAPMKLPHGAGPPPMRAPRALGMSSSGGSRGDGHIGKPVPIMASGGEYVLSPEQVARVGGGDVNHGHAVLDRWVQNTHKKFAKTIANLPPPAKT